MKELLGGICFLILFIIFFAFIAPLLLSYGIGGPLEFASMLFKNKVVSVIAGIAFIYVLFMMISHTGGLIFAIYRKDPLLSDKKNEFKLVAKICSVVTIIALTLGITTNHFAADKPDEQVAKTNETYTEYDEPYEDVDAISGATEETEPDYSDYNITGVVKNVYIADDGDPSFIDLDYEYPDKRRISVIIWPENLDKFQTLLDNLMYDDKIHIKGELETYKGVKQVELHDVDQLVIEGY